MMSFYSHFAVFSGFLLTVRSIPTTESSSQAAGFTAHQLANPGFVANGTKHLQAAYAKYSSFSTNQYTTVAPDSTPDEVVANPAAADSEYVISIEINGQAMLVNLDTGSADFWVWSTLLPQIEREGHTSFDPAQTDGSPFVPLLGYTWKISYGDGSGALGTVGTAAVNIGGAIVSNQAIELATSIAPSLIEDISIDGIVGFGWSNINTVKPVRQTTFFDKLKSTLPLPVFTADLRHDASGTYDFGFINASRYSGGDIYYQDVNTSKGYWQFSTAGYAVGTGSLVSPPSGLYPTIVDTGTSLLLMQDDLVEAYYEEVEMAEYDDEQQGYVFPCDATLPDLAIRVGSYSAVVGSQYLVYVEYAPDSCYGALQSSPANMNILGDPFFKSQFVVFDAGSTPRVGFASKS